MKEIVVTTLEEIKSELREIIFEAVMDGLDQYHAKEKEKFQPIEVAAEISKMAKQSLYGMKSRGEFEGKDICFNSGKRLLFDIDNLMQYLMQRKQKKTGFTEFKKPKSLSG